MKNLPDVAWPAVALAFRGYNTENLGRTDELLSCPAYEAIVRGRLEDAGEVCGDVLGRKVDLVSRVVERREPPLADYAEAVALLFAIECAQLDLLREVHGADAGSVEVAIGYSLGELVALVTAGAMPANEALRVPLAMANDSAALADDVTMGILFSRQLPIDERIALDLCDEISAEGNGVIGVSAVLSPNSLLVLGQHDTLGRFKQRMSDAFPIRVHLRPNDSRWPPLHTPIVWQKHIADRASMMVQQMQLSGEPPCPRVVSLVTGEAVGVGPDLRRTLRMWVDHPQRLWDGVCAVLHSPAQAVVHVGPQPNVIPATFNRLSENVKQITSSNSLSGLGARAIGRIVDRAWLSSRLPTSAALLRAPQVRQVILEDWLLANAPE